MLCKKAFIFDFDYTLGDSSHGIHDCINYGLTKLGFSTVSYEKSCEAIGKSLPDTLVHFTGEECRVRSNEFYKYFMEKAMEVMVQKCTIYPDVDETLEYLKSRNFKLAIASTKHRHRINDILSKFDLLDYFSIIVGGEDARAQKTIRKPVNIIPLSKTQASEAIGPPRSLKAFLENMNHARAVRITIHPSKPEATRALNHFK